MEGPRLTKWARIYHSTEAGAVSSSKGSKSSISPDTRGQSRRAGRGRTADHRCFAPELSSGQHLARNKAIVKAESLGGKQTPG